MNSRRILTASALETFARCPQAYNLRYNLLIYPTVYNSALSLGGAVHAGLEQLHLGRSLEEAFRVASEHLQERQAQALPFLPDERKPALCEQVAVDMTKARAMLRAHFQRWRIITGGEDFSQDLELQVLQAEQVLGPVPLINPATGAPSLTFALAGKMDALVRGRENSETGLMIYEFKTTGEVLDDFERTIRHAIQPQLYAVMARYAYDEPFSGIIIDMIKKPTLKGRKSESQEELEERMVQQYLKEPERFFRRLVLPYEEARQRQVRELAWRTAHFIRDSDRKGYLTVKGAVCRKSYGWCEYRPLCWYADFQNFRFAETPHEELPELSEAA